MILLDEFMDNQSLTDTGREKKESVTVCYHLIVIVSLRQHRCDIMYHLYLSIRHLRELTIPLFSSIVFQLTS